MKHKIAATILALALVSAPQAAKADLFEFWGSGLIGASFGDGKTDRDFFKWAGGGATGFEVGARVLFLSAFVDYLRFFGGETGANLFAVNLGGDGTIGLSAGLDLIYRIAGSYYLGSLDEVSSDGVSSSEVNTRGVGARGGLGLRFTFLKVLSVGITPEFGYHYFFGGADEDLTDTDANSHGWDMRLMGYLRLGVGL